MGCSHKQARASSQGLTASFDASSSSDAENNTLSYQWDFSDGYTDTGVTADHDYGAAGSYAVVLTVSDGLLATNSNHKGLQINLA
ncbi:PKD domain-containing protein [Agarivorans litoreus]|uniref:PKD domain-containing protein n=1 Tax=Agarivorans litoreus TaxID=1510455 RepID=UPI001FE8B8FC|nr:PKD domain-containing protein [Agarivorans litoreus]